MKKITIALLALALLLSLTGCGEEDGIAVLRSILQKKTSREILAFEYGDYGGDGRYEAFAFVGEEDGYEGCMGELWFVNAAGAQMLEASETGYWQIVRTVTFGGREFVWVEEYYATGGLVNLWSVRDGKPCRESISGVGGALEKLDENNLLLYHSTLDAMSCMIDGIGTDMGRTEKPYWFFWDGDCFREYGGMPMTENEIRKIDGAAEILENFPEGCEFRDIFYRGACGIININYIIFEGELDIGCFYKTLLLNDGGVSVVAEGDGYYMYALACDIMVQPELPIIFN